MSKTLSDAEYKRYRELLEEKYKNEWGSDDDPYKDKNRYTTGIPIEGSGTIKIHPVDGYSLEEDDDYHPEKEVNWKYCEDMILNDFREYLAKTYTEHYKSKTDKIECFDAWIALGDSGPTFRNTAIKYLWRYGEKDGKNKKDVMKALHYVLMLMYVEHYKPEEDEVKEEG